LIDPINPEIGDWIPPMIPAMISGFDGNEASSSNFEPS